VTEYGSDAQELEIRVSKRINPTLAKAIINEKAKKRGPK
jgi:hypothetical protein